MSLLALLVALLATSGALADGTEELGAPIGLELQPGSAILVGGIGLAEQQPGTISVEIPAGSVVRQIILYWEGQDTSPTGQGNTDQITVNDIPIVGTRIGGPTLFFQSWDGDAWTSTYRRDITGDLGPMAGSGNKIQLEIAGLDYARRNCGAGVFVIIDDGINSADIQVYDGNDCAYKHFLPPLNTTEPMTFTFEPSIEDRVAQFSLYFGSVDFPRPSIVRIWVDDVLVDQIIDELATTDGPEWDTVLRAVPVAAGATTLTVQALSQDSGIGPFAGFLPASMTWIATGLALGETPLGACCVGDGTCLETTEEDCAFIGAQFQGDFTTCDAVACPQPTGACCVSTGECILVDADICAAVGGVFGGVGTTCDPNPCTQPSGACCFPDGTCDTRTAAECQAAGGAYAGDDTSCTPNDCPQPPGACCFGDGSCQSLTAAECFIAGGTFSGMFTSCTPNDCPQPQGACCFPDGECAPSDVADCASFGGQWLGAGTACGPNPCPQPPGACCFADGSCQSLTEDDCFAAGGSFLGDFTSCTPNFCPQPPGACCFTDGSCQSLTEADCLAAGGAFSGAFTSCTPNDCPQPPGACCFGDGGCVEMPEAECLGAGGLFGGAFTSCAPNPCAQPPGACCFADGGCQSLTEADCLAAGGAFSGDFTDCVPNDCPQPPGACCFPDGSCQSLTEADCLAAGGDFQGDFTGCDGLLVKCPQPEGACCLADGTCIEVDEITCDFAGGAFSGDFTSCTPNDCPQPPGACCFADGTCQPLTEEDCIAAGGAFSGDFTICVPNDCPQPPGACCFADGTCQALTEEDCVAAGGAFSGDFTTCVPNDCPQPPGACCFTDGSCQSLTEEDCLAAGGAFSGDFTTCAPGLCPQPTGACCLPDGICAQLTQLDCALAGGAYNGDFMDCVFIRCEGACCLEEGACVDARTAAECAAMGGEFAGLATTCTASLCAGEREHPGWNWIDNMILLTGNEPTYWSARTGQPKGVSPFTILDPSPDPLLQGRPAPDGSGDRVLRGMVIAWAVDAEDEPIAWNHLGGGALLVDYRDGAAWEYNAWASQAVAAPHGTRTNAPPYSGHLELDGAVYASPYALLLVDFYATGSTAFSGGDPLAVLGIETELTLHPATADLRQEGDGPVTTKASFVVWNEDEIQLTGLHRCITCWDSTLLGQYAAALNHFLAANLQTDKGKARIDGLGSQLCDVDFNPGDLLPLGVDPRDVVSEPAALLGVVARRLGSAGGVFDVSGTNVVGMGTEPASLQYDPVGAPPTVDELAELLESLFGAPLANDDAGGGVGALGSSGVVRTAPAATANVGLTADRMSGTEKGSVLYFSRVELRWNTAGELVRDTFLHLTNDHGDAVRVQLYFINGDPPLAADP